MSLWDAWDWMRRSGARRATDRATRNEMDAQRDRATVVDGLRHEVRRLQTEIADLDRSGTGSAAGAQSALERDLDRTQRELNRYQARI